MGRKPWMDIEMPPRRAARTGDGDYGGLQRTLRRIGRNEA
jgi:hypothetical protein